MQRIHNEQNINTLDKVKDMISNGGMLSHIEA